MRIRFNLAPLEMRRDIGMLGLIHRTVLGKGPEQFRPLFERSIECNNPRGRESKLMHSRQLKTHRCGQYLDVLANSALGLADIYNLLPGYAAEVNEVCEFQSRLQELAREIAQKGDMG